MLKFVMINCLIALMCRVISPATASGEVTCNPGAVQYIAHANCSKFYVCDNGHLAELECPPSLYFNPELDVCDYPGNVPECDGGTREPVSPTPPNTPTTASTTIESPTTTLPSPTTTLPPPTTTVPSPTTTLPSPTTTLPSPTTTLPPPTTTLPPSTTTTPLSTTTAPSPTTTTPLPTTTAPSPTTTAPLPTTAASPPTTCNPTTPQISSTSSMPNNCPTSGVDKIPHASSCNLYIACINGAAYEIHCRNDLQFNPTKKECDLPENVNCNGAPTPELPTPTTLSPSFPECPPEGNSYHPLPGNCSFYVQCSEGFAFIQKCADDTCFNPEHLKCEAPAGAHLPTFPDDELDTDAICQNNHEEIMLYPSSGSCIHYHICFGLTYKGKQECRKGKHFHYFTQNCIPAEASDCSL